MVGMQKSSRTVYRYLPARAAVKSSAALALRKAAEQASGDLPPHRRSAGEAAHRPRVALILHPRDARQLRFPALDLGRGERLAALRSQLEASLLEDVQDLVIAARFAPQVWVAALCNRRWIEAIVAAADEQGMHLVGIWPAQACADASASQAAKKLAHGGTAGGEPHTPLPLESAPDVGPRAEAPNTSQDWPPIHRWAEGLDPAMNLLEAMLLHREEDPWGGLRGDRWWSPRALRLAGARLSWTLRTMPSEAWRQPLAGLLGLAVLAALALQLDTLRMRADLAESEAEVAKLFREIVPGTQAMVDPVIQAQRVLEQRRSNPSASADSQPDPLLALVLAHTALSRSGGTGAVEAVRSIEWKGREGSSGGILSLSWKPGALDPSTLKPLTQELAARASWTVQWGGSSESMMQWRAPVPESTRR